MCFTMIWALAIPVGVLYLFWRVWFKQLKVCRGGKSPGAVRPRIRAVLDSPEQIKYNVGDLHAPRVTGLKFKILTWLAYTRFGIYFIGPVIKRNSNLHALDGLYIPEAPTYYPTRGPAMDRDHSKANKAVIDKLVETQVSNGERESFHFPTVADYVRVYRSGEVTPTDVAKAVLNAISDSDKEDPPLRAIVQSNREVVLAMAEASTQRWKENRPLSLLDGVPVAVKEEFRVEPYLSRGGSTFTPVISEGLPECAIVRKLLDKGVVLIGVANMHEFGLGTLGSNPNKDHLTARNPYNHQCYPGGSSSGSAVSVAAGFCPITIGADGGGSVRIPAATCGVVGLKPTYDLIDKAGALPLAYTVGAPGPLCSSVLDVAIAMNVITKETDGPRNPLSLEGLGEKRLDGMKIGVYWEYFEHADPEIVSRCKRAVSQLESLGASIVEIKIPELEENRIALALSIMSEFGSALAVDIDRHGSEMNRESHFFLACTSLFSSLEYVNAQKQRTRAITSLKYLFDECKIDAIVTPATACPAPVLSQDAVKVGSLEAQPSAQMMRFASLCNLCGNPGLVVPVGYTSDGLPVGLQLMGGWYQEHTLLKIGWALEQSGAFPLKKPKVYYNVLKKNN